MNARAVRPAAALLAWLLLASAAHGAGPAALEVPEVVRLGFASLGEERVFESEPVAVRLGPGAPGRIVRLVLDGIDERWSGARVTFTSRAVRGAQGFGGPLVPGTPTTVLATGPGTGDAEGVVVLRITAPARRLGAGARALRLRWEVVPPGAGRLPEPVGDPAAPRLPSAGAGAPFEPSGAASPARPRVARPSSPDLSAPRSSRAGGPPARPAPG